MYKYSVSIYTKGFMEIFSYIVLIVVYKWNIVFVQQLCRVRNRTDSFYFRSKKNNVWLSCLTVIKHSINVIFGRKFLAFLMQVQKKTSKYIAVAYATDVAYATKK